jgi:hypothetical protein
LAFFSKTNVMIKILHNLALFRVKNAYFFAEIFEKIKKNHNIVPPGLHQLREGRNERLRPVPALLPLPVPARLLAAAGGAKPLQHQGKLGLRLPSLLRALLLVVDVMITIFCDFWQKNGFFSGWAIDIGYLI